MIWLHLQEPFRELLQQNGLQNLSDFMTFSGGRVLKSLPARTILKLELPWREGTKTFFLKRHRGRIRPGEIIRAFFSGFSRSWGRKEWEAIQAFREHGIPTLTAVAAGEKVSGWMQESFLMTEELEGFQNLELFLKKEFHPPLSREQIREKRLLIQAVARIARTMHDAGFNHRDFYCCHLFIRVSAIEGRELRVLDLQRVDRRRWFRSRWIMKDLAALNYSAPFSVITKTDRLRFLCSYLEGSVEPVRLRSLIRQVAHKTERIGKHDRKLQQRKAAANAEMGRLSA